MKSALISVAALAYVEGLKLDAEKDIDQLRFNSWANNEGHGFKNAKERDSRFQNWLKKDKEYKAINADPKNTFTVGHNKFSALTEEEFASYLDNPQFHELVEDSDLLLLAQGGQTATTCGI